MTDAENREKVIRGLEAHSNPKTCETCAGEDCPYYNLGGSYTEVTCSSFLAADALALLREQDEGIEPEISRKSVTETTVSFWYKCGACGEAIEQGDDEFCRHCGKKVKWDG